MPFRHLLRSAARALGAAALLGAGVGCRQQAPATPADSAQSRVGSGEIPIKLVGIGESAVVVQVMVNGRGPYDFILDTGATLTCVDATLEGELQLPERFSQFGVGAGVEGVGRIRLVTIDSLRIGPERARDLPACVLDLKHLGMLAPSIRGLVGLNFLKNYRVTLDFQRRALVLDES